MGKRLYVGNLSFSTTEAALNDLFAQNGTVESATILMDKFTGRSRGFGFVEMATDEEAKAVIEKLNGYNLDGREIVVNEASPQGERTGGGRGPRRGGNRFGGGGGGGRDRGGRDRGGRDRGGY